VNVFFSQSGIAFQNLRHSASRGQQVEGPGGASSNQTRITLFEFPGSSVQPETSTGNRHLRFRCCGPANHYTCSHRFLTFEVISCFFLQFRQGRRSHRKDLKGRKEAN
jgi:hypothetical protein